MKNSKNVLKGFLALISYFILSNCAITILNIMNVDYSKWSDNAKYLFNIGYELLILIIIIFILKDTVLNNFKIYIKNIKEYLSKYIKYWFIALGLMYVSNFIIIFITKDIAQNEQGVRALFAANPILTFILASLLAPILEELVFRLSIYKIIGKYKYLFIIVSGLIFGSMHVLGNVSNWTDLLYLIPYSIPGSVFAYTLVKSDNIFIPISLHFIHNTFALLMQVLATLLQ